MFYVELITSSWHACWHLDKTIFEAFLLSFPILSLVIHRISQLEHKCIQFTIIYDTSVWKCHKILSAFCFTICFGMDYKKFLDGSSSRTILYTFQKILLSINVSLWVCFITVCVCLSLFIVVLFFFFCVHMSRAIIIINAIYSFYPLFSHIINSIHVYHLLRYKNIKGGGGGKDIFNKILCIWSKL